MKSKIQLLEITIPTAKSEVRISENLDLDYAKLKGIAVLNSIGQGHLLRSCMLSGVELFPKNFEVAFLQSNASVSPKDRFFPLLEIADGKKIEIEYTDSGNAPVYPYSLKIYIHLSNG